MQPASVAVAKLTHYRFKNFFVIAPNFLPYCTVEQQLLAPRFKKLFAEYAKVPIGSDLLDESEALDPISGYV